ncbi:unnamed protein product [Linum tenue]|uniref:non-specific serine/threonine protein kinase n=1 Tax=Linum tenue TaxID=586396 RepID=A0AAV0MCE6_9ROSI|nr:unnamed protein product [Linum tenue]
MTVLYLADNNLSGEIPPEILNLPDLSRVLDLSRNRLSGRIPEEVGSLVNLGRLDLSNNVLSGSIPLSIGRCVRLENLNLMGNLFQGSIPSSLRTGTDGFSPANLLGVGSYGSVYKGLIAIDDANKIFVAVKVLNLHHYRAFKSFVAECEVLKNIRHKNLVKLLTVCSGIDFQGSLEEWLHPGLLDEQATERRAELSLLQRLNIAIDVGIALDYLHNESGVPVVHCDLKPSNILLDVNMVGHIGDFGLAKFLPQVELNAPTNHTTNSSSIAVQYGMGSEVSTNGDVYSYGILLLEMFTGRRPTDETFRDGLNLHNFAAALGDNAADYIDPRQDDNSSRSRTNEKQVFAEAVVSIVQVGVECSNEIARERMGISDAVTKLTAVRDKIVKRRN